jgi:hypothetical protein
MINIGEHGFSPIVDCPEAGFIYIKRLLGSITTIFRVFLTYVLDLQWPNYCWPNYF